MHGLLERAHDTAAQHALGRSGRAANVGGAFRIRGERPGAAGRPGPGHIRGARPGVAAAGQPADPAIHGRWLVLVDDVVTTGSTLAGCAVALMGAGAVAVSAVTVARER